MFLKLESFELVPETRFFFSFVCMVLVLNFNCDTVLEWLSFFRNVLQIKIEFSSFSDESLNSHFLSFFHNLCQEEERYTGCFLSDLRLKQFFVGLGWLEEQKLH